MVFPSEFPSDHPDKSFSTWTRYHTAPITVGTIGTDTQASATVVYLSQLYIGRGATLTGIGANAGGTVGTNKFIYALFDKLGAVVATTALAGVTTSGANAFQDIDFTAPVTVSPGVYWIGLYMNGTTDRFRSKSTIMKISGLAGSVSTQTFGTVAAITPPTTFTADLGPIAYTY